MISHVLEVTSNMQVAYTGGNWMRMQVASLREDMCGLYASRWRDEPFANKFHRMYTSTRGRLRHVVTLNQIRNGEVQLPRRCRHEARIKVGDTRNATIPGSA
jgi:hypothetical protein